MEDGILPLNPFQTIDRDGVGQLMKLSVEKGRSTRLDLECGICGEHGGDPASVIFCHHAGLNYVSCSPFRVPVARLAAAQAAAGARGAALDVAAQVSDDLVRSDLLQGLASRPVGLGPRGGANMADFDTLIELITSTVHTDSWDEVGGAGAILCSSCFANGSAGSCLFGSKASNQTFERAT